MSEYKDITARGHDSGIRAERQYYFMEQAKAWMAEQKEWIVLTACVVTFGCQMNARDSESWSAFWKISVIRWLNTKWTFLSFIIHVQSAEMSNLRFTDGSDT